MKKLMFATALAAAAAAFADAPINATAFANPEEYNPNIQSSYFYFAGDSDSSVVTNTSPSTEKHTANFASADDANYLALDTEGGTLWRSLATIGSETVGEDTTYSLGTAQPVAATGTYLDTLVQFTVTEDEAPEVTSGDKLAIWLQAGEGTTNLMVKAGLINDLGTVTETTFTLDATVNPDEWYRLTVKALADITDNEGIPGFQIYLDGTLLTSSTATLTSEYLEILGPDDVDDSHYADLVAGKYFASLQTDATLQGVGFQGTGAVDEIVWTEEDLFPAGGATMISFTLTGGENATVSYVIGSEASQTWDGTSAPISVESGATVTFTATPASGYTYTGVVAEGWTLNNDDLVCVTNSAESIELTVPSAIAIAYSLTVPTVANATLTSPQTLTGFAPGAEVTLTWTADEGYTFPNGQTTMTKTVTVNSDMTVDVSDIESALSKQTFTVAVVDIENATIAATTNNTALTDALSENSVTNQYTVEYGDAVTVTATAAEGYEYATAPEGWTLTEGVLSITTNVTADVELTAPIPTAVLATVTVTVTGGANATAAWTVDGASVAEAPATLTEGQTYEVTFSANSGYEFAAGATTTFSGTVGTEDITIAAPDATAIPVTVNVTVTGGANATAAWTVAGEPAASAPATLTEGQAWSVTLTAGEGYEFDGRNTYTTNGVAGAVDFSIALPDAKAVAEEEDWVDNPATDITAGDTAATAYPGLADSALATADAQKLTVWAKANNIAYSDIKADTTGTHTEAYLLNCAVADVADEKEAFVANITVDANGTPVVTPPAGKSYNGNLQLKGKVNLTDAAWTNVESASTTYKFYMYELSL